MGVPPIPSPFQRLTSCTSPWRAVCLVLVEVMSGNGGSKVTIATVLLLNGVRSYISDGCLTDIRRKTFDVWMSLNLCQSITSLAENFNLVVTATSVGFGSQRFQD